MKVVQIGAQLTGGAGIAMWRLHKGLLSIGIDSYILVMKAPCLHEKNVVHCEYNFRKPLWKRLMEKLKLVKTLAQTHRSTLAAFQSAYELFTFPETDYRVHEHPLLKDADVVHLHWVSGFVDLTFFRRYRKKIFWTMHDMNAFLGGFHYEEDLVRSDKMMKAFNQKIVNAKKAAFSRADIFPIFPSSWMQGKERNYPTFNPGNCQMIPNGIDFDVFKILNQKSVRSIFGLPGEKFIFLAVAENLGNYRKGFDQVIKVLDLLPEKVLIGVIGSYQGPSHHKIFEFGKINDQAYMSIILNVGNAMLIPSREDNLPNVMLEGLACGLPVVALENGGMQEHIIDQMNGVIIPEISEMTIQSVINAFKDLAIEHRHEIRNKALATFSLEKIARNHLNAYRSPNYSDS